MGNICGKQDPDPFSSPGRVVGVPPSSAPSTRKKATIPKHVLGPGRTLGTTTNPPPRNDNDDDDEYDAQKKAADAAVARAESSKRPGKLHAQLAAQKRQTRAENLREASAQEVRAREVDELAQSRRWD